MNTIQIDEYLRFGYFRAHYQAMAEEVERILDIKLKEEGIQFKLSARAKSKKNLREKLKVRYEEKHYETFEDIKKDVVDLAGVRIILYMPTKEDNARVKKVVQEEWGHEVKAVNHPPRSRVIEGR